MKRRDREEYITHRAYELACSGAHISPITVVTVLVEEGFPEAAELLNSDLIRTDLRAACAQHWRGVRPDDAVVPDGQTDGIGAPYLGDAENIPPVKT